MVSYEVEVCTATCLRWPTGACLRRRLSGFLHAGTGRGHPGTLIATEALRVVSFKVFFSPFYTVYTVFSMFHGLFHDSSFKIHVEDALEASVFPRASNIKRLSRVEWTRLMAVRQELRLTRQPPVGVGPLPRGAALLPEVLRSPRPGGVVVGLIARGAHVLLVRAGWRDFGAVTSAAQPCSAGVRGVRAGLRPCGALLVDQELPTSGIGGLHGGLEPFRPTFLALSGRFGRPRPFPALTVLCTAGAGGSNLGPRQGRAHVVSEVPCLHRP